MSIPVSTPPVAPQPQSAAPFNSVMLIGGKLKEYAGGTLKKAKAWSELLDRNALAKPANFGEATTRLRKNLAYFKINYLLILLGCITVGFILHPSSLFVLAALLAGWIYVFVVRQSPLTISGRTISEREKLIGMGVLSFITVFYFSSVSSVVFTWFLLGAAVVGLHGAARVPDDLFLDDVESANSGIISLFTGPSSTPSTS